MGDKKNIYFLVFSLLRDIAGKSKESIFALFSRKEIKKDGMLFSILYHSFWKGPKNFRKHPTGIALGRGIFTPLALLLSHRSSHESDDKK